MVIATEATNKIGRHDDGTAEGILRVKLDQGELVPLDIRDRGTVTNAAGTSSVIANTSTTDLTHIGVNGGLLITTPAGANSQGVRVATRAMGRRFALLLTTTTPGQPSEFDVLVNRSVVYSGSSVVRHAGVGVSVSESGYVLPVVDDLPDDGPHLIELITWPDPSASSSFTLVAVLAERRIYGGMSWRRTSMVQASVALTVSAALLPSGGHKNVRKLQYSSLDPTIAHTVIIDDGSTFVRTVALPAATTMTVNGTAGTVVPSYAEVDLGDAAQIGAWRHRLAAAPTSAGQVTCRAMTGN